MDWPPHPPAQLGLRVRGCWDFESLVLPLRPSVSSSARAARQPPARAPAEAGQVGVGEGRVPTRMRPTTLQSQLGPPGHLTEARPCPSLGLDLLSMTWTSPGVFKCIFLPTVSSVQIKHKTSRPRALPTRRTGHSGPPALLFAMKTQCLTLPESCPHCHQQSRLCPFPPAGPQAEARR